VLLLLLRLESLVLVGVNVCGLGQCLRTPSSTGAVLFLLMMMMLMHVLLLL
jgi:hypothetical protein